MAGNPKANAAGIPIFQLVTNTLIIHFSKDWGWAKQQDLACE